MNKKIQNVIETGRMGGTKTFERYGSSHMSKIAKTGRKNMKKRDPEYFKKLSKAGIHAREVKRQAWIKEQIRDSFTKLLIGG